MKQAKNIHSSDAQTDPKTLATLDAILSPAISARIARNATRQCIARLSCSSRRLCALFAPLLYQDLTNPPLTSVQSLRLIEKTLSADGCTGVHPALLIHRLSIAHIPKKSLTIPDACKNALENLHRLIPSGAVSPLRSLHWSVSSQIDTLGDVIGSGHFPNLKELVVSGNAAFIKSFAFMQKAGLDVFGLTLKLNVGERSADAPWFELIETLCALPLTSPSLHTLQLKFTIEYGYDNLPSEYADFLEALNHLPFPALQNLDLTLLTQVIDEYGFDDDEDSDPYHPGDLSGFLNLHPQLKSLKLNVPGTTLTTSCPFLTTLRSFQGSLGNASILLKHGTGLEELGVVHIHTSRFSAPAFSISSLSSAASTTLMKLSLSVVDANGAPIKALGDVSPLSLKSLVAAFPNLIHLDIHISHKMTKYWSILGRLDRLQSLRLQEYRFEDVKLGALPSVLPSTKYIQEMVPLLKSLPHLAHVEICALVDDGDRHVFFPSCGCRVESWFPYINGEAAEMRVNHVLTVSRDRDSVPEAVSAQSEFKEKRKGRKMWFLPEHECDSGYD